MRTLQIALLFFLERRQLPIDGRTDEQRDHFQCRLERTLASIARIVALEHAHAIAMTSPVFHSGGGGVILGLGRRCFHPFVAEIALLILLGVLAGKAGGQGVNVFTVGWATLRSPSWNRRKT